MYEGELLVSSETWQAPAWDQLDKLILRAHLRNEGDRCRCGGYRSDHSTSNPNVLLERPSFKITQDYCLRCHAQFDWEESRKKVDELMWNSPLRQYPEARRLVMEAAPPPE